jgi:hypothetical protein
MAAPAAIVGVALSACLVLSACGRDGATGPSATAIVRDTAALESTCQHGSGEALCRCVAREVGGDVAQGTYERLVAIAEALTPEESRRLSGEMTSTQRAEAQRATDRAREICSRPETIASFQPSQADRELFAAECRKGGSPASKCECYAEAVSREMDTRLFHDLARGLGAGDAEDVVSRLSGEQQTRFLAATSKAASQCGMN